MVFVRIEDLMIFFFGGGGRFFIMLFEKPCKDLGISTEFCIIKLDHGGVSRRTVLLNVDKLREEFGISKIGINHVVVLFSFFFIIKGFYGFSQYCICFLFVSE